MTTPTDIEPTENTEEIGPNYDDVNTGMIALVAALSAIVTLAVIIAVQAFFFQYQENLLEERVVNQKTSVQQSMLTEQLQSVSEYGVISKPDGIYAIPIDRAMEIVVEDTNKARKKESTKSATPPAEST